MFPPQRLRSHRHIAHIVFFFFLSLFMLRSFSMSWNAMSLVLLTLYSVIHFIINSLPNVIVSLIIEEQTDILKILEVTL